MINSKHVQKKIKASLINYIIIINNERKITATIIATCSATFEGLLQNKAFQASTVKQKVLEGQNESCHILPASL